jgi:hypothetical protein
MLAIKRHVLYNFRQLVRHALAVIEDDGTRPINLERRQYEVIAEIDRMKAAIRDETPDDPVLSGFKVYSQVDEDGIIEALLARLPPESRSHTAIEIGCGNGTENNTHFLLLKGFSAVWVDGSTRELAVIRRELGLEDDRKGRLLLAERFVTLENVEAIIADACIFLGTDEPDFFSLDVDGNDYHLLAKAIDIFKPKIICVEYNGKFPPPSKLIMPYNPTHLWSGDDYHGASLAAFCDLLPNYALVTCNISGSNAFFIRQDYVSGFKIYPASAVFRPLRPHLRFLQSGHPPSFHWLRGSLDSDLRHSGVMSPGG